MDPETKRLLEENLKLSRENNKILHQMRSSMRWSKVIRVFYWLVIIGSMLGAYYYFQPLLKVISNQYEMGASFLNKLQSGAPFEQLFDTNQKVPQK